MCLKINNIVRAFIVSASILLSAGSYAYAAPVVSSVSGTLTHGSTLTINGSGFGTKTAASPWRWDPVEGVSEYDSLNHGDLIPATQDTGYWDKNRDGIKYNTNINDQRGVSEANFYTDNGTNCPGDEDNKKLVVKLPTASERYFSFWIWHNITLTDQNAKVIRWWTSQGSNENHLTVQQSWTTNGPWWLIKRDDFNSTTCIDSGVIRSPFVRPIGGEWERVELYIKDESSKPASNDGVIWLAQTANNDIHTYAVDPANFNCGSYAALNWLTFGFDKNCTGNSTPVEIRMDDIYIDNTRARVEVGDAPTWTANNHREIQIPSSWSDKLVTVTLNQGSFNDFNSLYLYIIDKNGNVNTNGYPLCPSCPSSPPGPSAY